MVVTDPIEFSGERIFRSGVIQGPVPHASMVVACSFDQALI